MKTLTEKQVAFMVALGGTVCRSHIESLFLYHASPVLRQVKPAALITVRSECVEMWKKRESAMCKASGLHMTELKRKERSSLFLIYDEQEIASALKQEDALRILRDYGYGTGLTAEGLIAYLAQRFAEDDFPHEVGLFLGYPPGDVKAYIENGGKNWACCRYWKVYENVETAQETWAKIDEAQARALDVLQSWPPIHVAANLLKAV